MSKYSINDTTLSAISNAIKEKEGTSEAIAVSDFANRIVNLPSGGPEIKTDFITYFINNQCMVKTILKDYYNGDLDKIVSFTYFSLNNPDTFFPPNYIYVYNKDICPIYRDQQIKAGKYDSTFFRGDVLACNTLFYNNAYNTYTLYIPSTSSPVVNTFGLTYNSINNCLNMVYYSGSSAWQNNDRYIDGYDSSGHIYITQEV